MKKQIRIFLLAFLCAVLSAFSAMAAETVTVETVPAPDGDWAAFSDMPVSLGEDLLFCGWFTTESAAKKLDLQAVAQQPADARYGAVLRLSDGAFRLVGAQLQVGSPYGMRFVTQADRTLLRTLEKLHPLNCAGKDGTLAPRSEQDTGIGYGTVLALDTGTAGMLKKQSGADLRAGMTVPGTYICAENKAAVRYTAPVPALATEQLADRIAARPYITYADANGEERTYYCTEPDAANGAYAASLWQVMEAAAADTEASDAAKTAAEALRAMYAETPVKVTRISALNTDVAEDSADFANAYIETDYTTRTYLSSQSGAHYRYTANTNYSRIVKVNDSLYLMLFQYGERGVHLYYATSTDGIHWSDTPSVLYNKDAAENRFTYTDGPLEGTADVYYASTADAAVLDDGTVLVVYARRPNSGYTYREYIAMNSLEMLRGSVVNGQIVFEKTPTTIYRGTVWEPEIIQRSNGRVEVYLTHAAPMIDLYGFQSSKRSSGIGLLVSDDRGKTWTPDLATMEANHYAAKRIYQQFSTVMQIADQQVNFYSGQMPAVVEMTDGRLLLAVEFEPAARNGMLISAAFSDADGAWEEVALDAVGPAERYENIFKGAAPSLCRFPSGEILLSYNSASKMYTRLLKKDASDLSGIAGVYALDVFGNNTSKTKGYWSTVATKDSHTAILSMAFPCYENYGDGKQSTRNDNSAVGVIFGRLNHTVHALCKNVVADGNPQEWAEQGEALFIGSRSAAQASYRFAYDRQNVYVCIDYLNARRADDDSLFVLFETSAGETVTARISGAGVVTETDGIRGGAVLTADGGVYELALDRAALGLQDGELLVCPGLTAGGMTDRIDGMSTSSSTWITVKLESETVSAD